MKTKATDERIHLLANGGWLFRIKDGIFTKEYQPIQLKLMLSGTTARGIGAHVIVAVNGHFVTSFFVNDSNQEFDIELTNENPKVVSLFFNNDLRTDLEDRNLYLQSIELKTAKNTFPLNNYSTFKQPSAENTGVKSAGHLIQNYINDLGLWQGPTQVITYNPTSRNKTLLSAKAFHNSDRSKDLEAFNVISSGIHARRSWITYRSVFNEKADIGIFNHPAMSSSKARWYFSFHELKYLLEEQVLFIGLWLGFR